MNLHRNVLNIKGQVEHRIGKAIKILPSDDLEMGAQATATPNTDRFHYVEYAKKSIKYRDYLIIHECLHLLRGCEEPEYIQMIMAASQREKDKLFQDLFEVEGENDAEGINKSAMVPSIKYFKASAKFNKNKIARYLRDTLSIYFQSAVYDVWVFNTIAKGHLGEDIIFDKYIVDQQGDYYQGVMKRRDRDPEWKLQEVNPKWFHLMASFDYAFYELVGKSILNDASLSLPNYFNDQKVIDSGSSLREIYLASLIDSSRDERNVLDSWARELNIDCWYHWEPLHAQ